MHASYQDWQPVCYIWHGTCATKIMHVLAMVLTPGPKFTKAGDDLILTEIYYSPNFVAQRQPTSEIPDKISCGHSYTVPTMPMGM